MKTQILPLNLYSRGGRIAGISVINLKFFNIFSISTTQCILLGGEQAPYHRLN